MNANEILSLAKRFFDAIERGEIDTVRSIYARDAIIWHNTDGKESSAEENIETLGQFIRAVPTRSYTKRRLSAFDGGFVQQHVLQGNLANGKEINLPACIVCAVQGGRITRLDEYFDSAALAVFRS